MTILHEISKKQPLYSFSIRKVFIKVILWIFFGIFCLAGGWLSHRLDKIEAKQKKAIRKLEERVFTSHESTLPLNLAGVPFGEELNIVCDVIEVPIRNVTAPYNPGICKTATGYDVFFRYDIMQPKMKDACFQSHIGVVSLDHQLKQGRGEFKPIDLGTNSCEDPRVLTIKDELFLFYNCKGEETPGCRFMCLANLDPKTYEANYQTTLDANFQWIEKNWSPFEYVGSDQKHHLLFEYRINPRKVFELPNPQVNEIKNLSIPAPLAYLQLMWSSKWGEISGGTPALRVGDEYLGFFHSWFVDQRQCVWYVMGAYTFAPDPPFQLTGISTYPLLFKGIYNTPLIHTASVNKRVIFPSGFTIEKTEKGDRILLACGENDASVKIIVLDKENLLHNLFRF